MNARDALRNLDAYNCWANSYPPVPHNPLMRAEQRAMIEHWPDVAGARALDLACGTGRYACALADRGAAHVVAVDFSPAMLRRSSNAHRVRADMMALPFANGVFDVVVSGLAVGHAPDITLWMREAARVLVAGGELLYSDFHSQACAAGMTRSFTDEHHQKHTLSHNRYDLPDHQRAAAAADLAVDVVHELRVGMELQETFPGSDRVYHRWHGLPIVLVIRARKGSTC
jgi:SAM-dependent methyltransferase